MDIEKLDAMTNEEICKLYQQNRDDRLFEYFLSRNESLMYTFIHKYIRKHPEHTEDIQSLAKMGMWEAMVGYDESQNTKFSTFYHYYVLKALTLFYRELYMIRVPAWRLRDVESIEQALCLSLNISVKTNDDDVELMELCADDSQIACDDYLENDPDHTQMNKALATLDGRTQQCLKWYLGLVDGDRHTLEEIGEMYGVTRERIRQIMVKGLNKLRKTIDNYLDTTGYQVNDQFKSHLSVCNTKGDKYVRKRTTNE